MPKPPPRFTSGGAAPILAASVAGERDRGGLRVDQRLRIERLRAGEDVEAAPVGAGVEDSPDQRRHARGIDAERLGAAAHAHAGALDLEIGIDPHREPRPPVAAPIASARSTSPSDSQLSVTPASIAASKLAVALAGPGEADRRRVDAGLERDAKLAGRSDVEPVHAACRYASTAADKDLLSWHNEDRPRRTPP